jgi:hypothetical protein
MSAWAARTFWPAPAFAMGAGVWSWGPWPRGLRGVFMAGDRTEVPRGHADGPLLARSGPSGAAWIRRAGVLADEAGEQFDLMMPLASCSNCPESRRSEVWRTLPSRCSEPQLSCAQQMMTAPVSSARIFSSRLTSETRSYVLWRDRAGRCA